MCISQKVAVGEPQPLRRRVQSLGHPVMSVMSILRNTLHTVRIVRHTQYTQDAPYGSVGGEEKPCMTMSFVSF